MIRLSASASTTIPAIDPSRSAKYSPWPASRTARARSESSTAAIPAMYTSTEIPSESGSTASAPSMIGSLSPGSQIHTDSPIAVKSVAAVRRGTIVSRAKRERSRPTISTISEPPSTAISGDSAL